MFGRVFMHIAKGNKKKLTSEFIEWLQGMKVNERKWRSYKSRKKINNGEKSVWEVQSFCGMCNSTESNRRLSEGKPLSVSLTLRRLMSYIYGAPILDVSRSHTTTQHSR